MIRTLTPLKDARCAWIDQYACAVWVGLGNGQVLRVSHEDGAVEPIARLSQAPSGICGNLADMFFVGRSGGVWTGNAVTRSISGPDTARAGDFGQAAYRGNMFPCLVTIRHPPIMQFGLSYLDQRGMAPLAQSFHWEFEGLAGVALSMSSTHLWVTMNLSPPKGPVFGRILCWEGNGPFSPPPFIPDPQQIDRQQILRIGRVTTCESCDATLILYDSPTRSRVLLIRRSGERIDRPTTKVPNVIEIHPLRDGRFVALTPTQLVMIDSMADLSD